MTNENQIADIVSPAVKVSVVVCTFNRAESLRRTLASLAQMEAPADLLRELIVVDMSSTDDTRVNVEAADGSKENIGSLL